MTRRHTLPPLEHAAAYLNQPRPCPMVGGAQWSVSQ